jgi:AcrR family transcriptional regulator
VTRRATASAPKGRREVNGAAGQPTREVILDTAERLFALRGFDGVALRDLAREMDLTAPSLYNHFSSKQALYEAVLERGVKPIVDVVVASWPPDSSSRPDVRTTVTQLVDHLATHPHLAPLLQRAILEQDGSFGELLARWLAPLYRQGSEILRDIAEQSGWPEEQVPLLTLGLFGLVFSYFTNIAGLAKLTGWRGGVMSPKGLARQRQFLEEALLRLIGPRPTPPRS